MLYTCLFATTGTDLRGLLRAGATDEEITTRLAAVWSERRDRYSEQRATLGERSRELHKIEMNYIGG